MPHVFKIVGYFIYLLILHFVSFGAGLETVACQPLLLTHNNGFVLHSHHNKRMHLFAVPKV